MSAYLQMGHASENLAGADGVPDFSGIILSPINRNPDDLLSDVRRYHTGRIYDTIFDPQLYSPTSERGFLRDYPYYPHDIDTADQSSVVWWTELAEQVADFGNSLNADAICSPAIIPRKVSHHYCTRSVEVYRAVKARTRAPKRVLLTLCVDLDDLADENDALSIASAVTAKGALDGVYLVAVSNTEPRRELTQADSLASLMVLIKALENAHCPVIVSHCCSDMMLMKAAGASHCASGKFFNPRRFTTSRFEETEEGGGGQLPYWYEHNLCAFLREADIAALKHRGLSNFIGSAESRNAYGEEILRLISLPDKPQPWVASSWRQYLSWFSDIEARLSRPEAASLVTGWLNAAEKRWHRINKEEIILQEKRNDGRWTKPWRQALKRFAKVDFSGEEG